MGGNRKKAKFTHFKRKPHYKVSINLSNLQKYRLHSLWKLYSSSKLPDWIDVYDDKFGKLTFYNLRPGVSGSLEVFKSVEITCDLKYTVYVVGSKVPPTLLNNAPPEVNDLLKLKSLLDIVNASKTCIGNPDIKFQPLIHSRGGKFLNRSGETVASVESALLQSPTIRHTQCTLLAYGGKKNHRCEMCTKYRTTLRSLSSKTNHGMEAESSTAGSTCSHVNFRYLTTTQKLTRMRSIKKKYVNTAKKLKYMKSKLKKIIDKQGVSLDETSHSDIKKVMEEIATKKVGEINTPFREIFWSQQMKAATTSDSRQMKWHPLMIRWALYLRHQSNKCYETLRESKCIVLPSQRTLRDYTHYLHNQAGVSREVTEDLMRVAKVDTMKDYQKCVCLAIDEMHIREGLVFNKGTGAMVGYTDLGDVNNQLLKFEQSLKASTTSTKSALSTPAQSTASSISTALQLAKSMLVIFVCGLFTKLKYPFAQFPSLNLTGDLLFNPFWECVKRLEFSGFKVVAATADGAKCNRTFFRMHGCKNDLFRTLNPFATDRFIYFFSDPPHLLKTARNCLASSKRKMWCNGKDISWSHIVDYYYNNCGTGLSITSKIKYEHIFLSSFSKMRVDLAAQVLSSTMSNALIFSRKPHVTETAKFLDMMNKFFDCLNVTNPNTGAHKRNKFIDPWKANDFRVKWLQDTFLGYLDSWEKSVMEREGFSKTVQYKMLLSTETRLGIRFTVKSLLGLQQYLFTIPGVKYFLTAKLNQDPLEKFFGLQRQRGAVNENPNAKEFLQNTQALRVIDTVCGTVRGNVRGADKRGHEEDVDLQPLRKRKRK